MEPKGSRRRLIIFGVIGVLLVWFVITRSLAAYYAESSPDTALFLNGGLSSAIFNRAEKKLGGDPRFQTLPPIVKAEPGGNAPAAEAPPPAAPAGPGEEAPAASSDTTAPPTEPSVPLSAEDLAALDKSVERGVRNDPLNARGFRLLGQISSLNPNDDARTEALMQAAVRRSLLEAPAVYWLIDKSYRDRDYSRALAYADVLLRTNPRAMRSIAPVFGKLAETQAANAEVKQLLASAPPWRTLFFKSFPGTVTDARTPLDIFLSLKETSTPPSSEELKAYLEFLLRHGFFDLAYYTWLQFLSPGQIAKAGYLFNGGFDTQPSGLPFDWGWVKTPGVRYGIVPRPDKPTNTALRLEFGPGRVEWRDVVQVTTLPPGAYKLSGMYKSDLVSARGLEWRVTCPGKQPVVIGQSQSIKGVDPAWLEFSFPFNVPDRDCPGQTLRLVFDARSASEQFISGSVWFDDLQIARDTVAQAEQQEMNQAQPQGASPAPPAPSPVQPQGASPVPPPPQAQPQGVSPASPPPPAQPQGASQETPPPPVQPQGAIPAPPPPQAQPQGASPALPAPPPAQPQGASQETPPPPAQPQAASPVPPLPQAQPQGTSQQPLPPPAQ